MAMNLTDPGSNMHSEEQQNPNRWQNQHNLQAVCINDEAEGLCYFER